MTFDWSQIDYNRLQQQFIMARNSKSKINFQLMHDPSIVFNFVSLFIIFLMAYKYYRIYRKITQLQSSCTQSQTKQQQPKQQGKKTQNDKQVQREERLLKREQKHTQNTSKQQTHQNAAKLQKKIGELEGEISKRVQTEHELKRELELQQERGRFLQEKVYHFQQLLRQNQNKIPSLAHKPSHTTNLQSTTLTDLKNQLQFCQKRLLVSQTSEKELRLKLEEYQKIGQYSLDHPQYIRLRQMNTRYKQIIANLQTYLLQKNQAHPNLNISFNDL